MCIENQVPNLFSFFLTSYFSNHNLFVLLDILFMAILSILSSELFYFMKLIRKLDNEHRARLLQFVTGTCHLPLGGFSELTGE